MTDAIATPPQKFASIDALIASGKAGADHALLMMDESSELQCKGADLSASGIAWWLDPAAHGMTPKYTLESFGVQSIAPTLQPASQPPKPAVVVKPETKLTAANEATARAMAASAVAEAKAASVQASWKQSAERVTAEQQRTQKPTGSWANAIAKVTQQNGAQA